MQTNSFVSQAIQAISDTVFYEISLFGQPIGLIVLWLAIPMVFFTFYLGFVNIRGFGHAISLVRGRFSDDSAPGEVTQFQALSTALSGTVGLGNIAGVAIALAAGGPGAAFWMFVIGWFAMTLKCAEVTLGLKYREITPEGHVRGGPMYTLKNGLAARGWAKTGLIMGGIYAALALLGAIPMLQVNQSFAQTADMFGFERTSANGWIYGAIMAVLVGGVVLGGIRWIGRVTSWIVPTMGIAYLGGIFIILLSGYDRVPEALAMIVSDAFTGKAAAGGAIGAFVIGMRRAVFSTEAGVGSAVIAHAQAKTDEPASEGLVALLEPFIDTVVICSLGALAMVVAGTYADPELKDIAITSAAFAQISWWFPWLLALAVFLFAYSTLCAWGFYGLQAWGYLFGTSRFASGMFKTLYLVSLPTGAVLTMGQVVDVVDSAFFLMAIPNVIALYIFAPELKREITGYLARLKAGETSPAAARKVEE